MSPIQSSLYFHHLLISADTSFSLSPHNHALKLTDTYIIEREIGREICEEFSMDKSYNKPEISNCDFCNHEHAVLYCKADSAKLCLFCDQQVHSANALSFKHVRSPICDYRRSDPVAVGGFSGNPSAVELASAWGIDLNPRSLRYKRFTSQILLLF